MKSWNCDFKKIILKSIWRWSWLMMIISHWDLDIWNWNFDTFGTFEFWRDHFEILEGSFEIFLGILFLRFAKIQLNINSCERGRFEQMKMDGPANHSKWPFRFDCSTASFDFSKFQVSTVQFYIWPSTFIWRTRPFLTTRAVRFQPWPPTLRFDQYFFHKNAKLFNATF